MRSIRRDTRGATAIEYAIIAGLIGLGIVGSLVTTRGSLSAIFGVAATQMGSSTTPALTSLAASSIPQSSTWSSKTLSDGYPKIAPPTKSYAFTDGTSVTYSYYSSSKQNTIVIIDPSSLTKYTSIVSDDGSYVYSSVLTYYDANMTSLSEQYNSRVSTPRQDAPPIYNQIDNVRYNADGSRSYSATTSPNSSQAATMDSLYYYNKYFRGL